MRLLARGRSALPGAVAAGLVWLGSGLPAQAFLVLCNVASTPIELVVAYENGSTPGAYSTTDYGDLDPGSCQSVHLGSGEAEDIYHFTTSEPGFSGTGERFCVGTGAFYIDDARRCSAADERMADFRKVVLRPGEFWTLRNLDGSGGEGPQARQPMIDLSRPFQPQPQPRPSAGAGGAYASGLVPGSYGPAFDLPGFWQGCDTGAAGPGCSFHSGLWRFVVPDGAAYPADFLDRLATLPRGTPVSVSGDMIEEGGITVVAAVSEVRLRPDEPFHGILMAIQGDWAMLGLEDYLIRIEGSEIIEYEAGVETERMYLELMIGCPDEDFVGPALQTITLGAFEQRCFAFESLTESRLEMSQGEDLYIFSRR